MTAALHVSHLTVTYPGEPPVRAVHDLSFTVEPGECLGVLGESGSGKSTVAKALLGMAAGASVEGGMYLGDLDLGSLDREAWRDVRWRRIALGFQSTASLNPVLHVGLQLAEPLQVHLGMTSSQAEQRAKELLTEVSLGDWAAGRYPGELSGGQRRLVLLAIALACGPEVLLLDEPTAGLDGVTRTRVLDLLTRIRDEGRTAIVLLGHDVDTLEVVATQTAVLYRGWMAERGPAKAVLSDPRSPYSWALINARATLGSIKELRGIRGEPPDPTEVATGCPFLARCTQAIPECSHGAPPLVAPTGESDGRVVACTRGGVVSLLAASHLRKEYESRSGVFHHDRFLAVDDIGVDVREGEVVGIVGGTGAGKSTLAMLLLRVLEPDGGTITLEGRDLLAAKGRELKAAQRRAQIVFQDPFEALSPRLTIAQAVREPLDIQDVGTPAERDAKVVETLRSVRLPANRAFLDRHTHELSGGQLQRVALARALILEPKLLVADEPVSMLDPSEGVRMLELLKHLKIERGLALVIVSHDMATVLRIADRVIVIDQGRVVEEGPGRDILLEPKHPVTCALLVAAGGQPAQGVAPKGLEPAPANA